MHTLGVDVLVLWVGQEETYSQAIRCAPGEHGKADSMQHR